MSTGYEAVAFVRRTDNEKKTEDPRSAETATGEQQLNINNIDINIT